MRLLRIFFYHVHNNATKKNQGNKICGKTNF